MAVDRNALRKWVKARRFALGLPGATEEFPWGETVATVDKQVSVFLGVTDGRYPLGLTVELKDETARAHAPASPGAAPAGYGIGRAGWVSVPLAAEGAPAAALLCDGVAESYRTIAPRRRTAEPDAR
ncbi:MmcQ/YjbR family DNA-binding protein [Streptomyces bobili]|uniref:MmcQ/YjbR family DNA-binding protein n=1 Tax=Streptomyces bobili TaxID=67280 RepID=UPI0033A11EE5